MFKTKETENAFLARMIRQGLDYATRLRSEGIFVVETPYHYFAQSFPDREKWMLCVIGFALLGKFEDFERSANLARMVWRRHSYTEKMCKEFAHYLGVSEKLIMDIDFLQLNRHQNSDNILRALDRNVLKIT